MATLERYDRAYINCIRGFTLLTDVGVSRPSGPFQPQPGDMLEWRSVAPAVHGSPPLRGVVIGINPAGIVYVLWSDVT